MTEVSDNTVELTPPEAAAPEPAPPVEEVKPKKKAEPKIPEGHVMVRVLKKGVGNISTGQHISGVGEVHFAKDDQFQCARETADVFEDRGWVEIL